MVSFGCVFISTTDQSSQQQLYPSTCSFYSLQNTFTTLFFFEILSLLTSSNMSLNRSLRHVNMAASSFRLRCTTTHGELIDLTSKALLVSYLALLD